MHERVQALKEQLSNMIDLAEEGSQYKGEYLRTKHGDAEYIAKAKEVLNASV